MTDYTEAVEAVLSKTLSGPEAAAKFGVSYLYLMQKARAMRKEKSLTLSGAGQTENLQAELAEARSEIARLEALVESLSKPEPVSKPKPVPKPKFVWSDEMLLPGKTINLKSLEEEIQRSSDAFMAVVNPDEVQRIAEAKRINRLQDLLEQLTTTEPGSVPLEDGDDE